MGRRKFEYTWGKIRTISYKTSGAITLLASLPPSLDVRVARRRPTEERSLNFTQISRRRPPLRYIAPWWLASSGFSLR